MLPLKNKTRLIQHCGQHNDDQDHDKKEGNEKDKKKNPIKPPKNEKNEMKEKKKGKATKRLFSQMTGATKMKMTENQPIMNLVKRKKTSKQDVAKEKKPANLPKTIKNTVVAKTAKQLEAISKIQVAAGIDPGKRKLSSCVVKRVDGPTEVDIISWQNIDMGNAEDKDRMETLLSLAMRTCRNILDPCYKTSQVEKVNIEEQPRMIADSGFDNKYIQWISHTLYTELSNDARQVNIINGKWKWDMNVVPGCVSRRLDLGSLKETLITQYPKASKREINKRMSERITDTFLDICYPDKRHPIQVWWNSLDEHPQLHEKWDAADAFLLAVSALKTESVQVPTTPGYIPSLTAEYTARTK